jgi:hypothetical protein
MKRPYLLAASLLALVASATSACHRRDNCVSTTSTTSATLTSGEAVVQTPAPNTSPSPAVTAATPPTITPADLPNAPGSTATTSAAAGSTATEARDAGATSATGPVDISGPTPATPADGSSAGTTTTAPTANGNAAHVTPTPAAPLVAPGLDNAVTGGVSNTGAPFSYGAASPAPWYGPAPMTTMSRPIGGPMRPGAASDPNTTSGAR